MDGPTTGLLTSTERDLLRSALDHAHGIDRPHTEVERLPGTSGRSVFVRAAGRALVARLPEPGAPRSTWVDRVADAAASADLAPVVLHREARTGVELREFLPGRAFAPGGGLPAAMAPTLGARLAEWHRVLAGLVDGGPRLNPAAAIDAYLDQTPALGGPLTRAFRRARTSTVLAWRRAERAWPGEVVCHGDPSPGNLIMGPDTVRFIDPEYALVSIPAWDLAVASLEADFGPAAMRALVASYHAASLPHGTTLPTMRRMLIATMAARVGADVVSAAWSVAQRWARRPHATDAAASRLACAAESWRAMAVEARPRVGRGAAVASAYAG